MSEVAGDAGEERVPPEAVAAQLDAALSRSVPMAVGAINEHGLYVAMPPELDLHGHSVLTGYASALDLMAPTDLELVIEAWERAHRVGVVHFVAHLAQLPEQEVSLGIYDVTSRYGVFIGVLELPPGGAVVVDAGSDSPSLRPRVATVRKNELGVFSEVDAALPLMLGWTADQMIGVRSLEFVDPRDHEVAIGSWMSMLAEPGGRRRARLRHRHADGSWVWFDVTNYNRLADADHGDVLCEMVDVTQEMAAQEALREREQLLRRLTDTLPVGVVQFDREGRTLYRNDRVVAMLDAAQAATTDDLFARVLPEQRDDLQRAIGETFADGADRALELAVDAHNGDRRRVTVTLRALTDDRGSVTGAIACVNDVTESARLREELAHRATYDELTGCQNRASILTTLGDLLAVHGDAGVGVVFVDLDGFKDVNDGFGHLAGDAVLKSVAARLATGVRHDDVVGRLGGDEFLVVCPHVASQEAAERIGERVAALLHADVVVHGRSLELRASIGVAWATGSDVDIDALVAEADQAMYESKRGGRCQPVVHELALVRSLPRQPDGREVSGEQPSTEAAASARDATGRSTRG